MSFFDLNPDSKQISGHCASSPVRPRWDYYSSCARIGPKQKGNFGRCDEYAIAHDCHAHNHHRAFVSVNLGQLAISFYIDVISLTLEQYSARFAKHFSTLPTLPAFIAMISAAPNQFREILPTEASSTMSIRQLYLDALIWLLKHDLVVQVHTRARIYARAEVKETAWRKLWHRRRERWLSVRRKSSSSAKSTKSPMTSPDDLITPRATEENRFNPMEASVPPPKIDASFMEYDLDLEMDSDLNEDDAENSEKHEMVFSMNETEPKTVPRFEGSFIFKPARAQKDEARWLRVIREPVEEVWASKFDL